MNLNRSTLFTTFNNLMAQGWLLPLLTFVVSFVLMVCIGRPMIAWLKNLRGTKWEAREDTPDTHLQKAGTPSMGGLGIIGAATIGYTALIASLFVFTWAMLRASSSPFVVPVQTWVGVALLPLFTIAHMILGLVDDWSKAKSRGGLRARDKFLGQLGLAMGFLLLVGYLTQTQSFNGIRYFASGVNGDFLFDAHNIFALLSVFVLLTIVLVGTCNAVNITDGIDGLAAGLCIEVGLCILLLGSPNLNDIKAVSDLWWLALAGACAGFLVYNRFPARVFMGDTGSLALGAALGGAAILSRAVFLLPFIGFMFFVEMASVMIQVAYFKYSRRKTGEGQRIFRRAPLHHHFELGGWSEWRVVLTFWAINLVMALVGLSLWNAGILPRFP